MKVKVAAVQVHVEGRAELLNLFANDTVNIRVTSIRVVEDGYLLYFPTSEEADRLFLPSVIAALAAMDLEPMMPAELKARRSVILGNVDNSIYDNQEEIIKEEIYKSNEWARVKEVKKFRNSTLKVIFEQAIMSQLCREKGLKLFKLYIPGNSINQDQFYHILTCFRCYKVEDHATQFCDKPAEYKICSMCSREGHTWKNCKAAVKKCLNCGGNHCSIAMSCDIRKKILQEKRRRSRNLGGKDTYASRIGTGSCWSSEHSYIVKACSCVLLATLGEFSVRGSFQSTIKKLFIDNSLTPVNVTSFQPLVTSMVESFGGEASAGSDVGESDHGNGGSSVGAPTASASKQKRKVASKQSRCGGSSSEDEVLEQADGRRQVESTSNGGRGRGRKAARGKPASRIR